MPDVELSEFDFILLMIIGYGFGVMTGLCFCAKYRNIFLTRSLSMDNFKNLNHQQMVYPPEAPIIQASAPVGPLPPKITIQ
tara:strand:+ start:74 stop:316 length:243 start_codon:yes stop_codon:yes gene_type:complete